MQKGDQKMINDILTLLLTGIVAIGDFLLMLVSFLFFDIIWQWATLTLILGSVIGFAVCIMFFSGFFCQEVKGEPVIYRPYEDLLTGALREAENDIKSVKAKHERQINSMQKAFDLEKDQLIRNHNRTLQDLTEGHNKRVDQIAKTNTELVDSLNDKIDALCDVILKLTTGKDIEEGKEEAYKKFTTRERKPRFFELDKNESQYDSHRV